MEFFNYWKKHNYKKPVNKKPVIKKQPKIFNIDVNKCRKNILYYSNYDYPHIQSWIKLHLMMKISH